MKTKNILGLPYAAVSVAQATDMTAKLVLRGGFAAVFTPGATVAAQIRRDPALQKLFCQADLLLPDGSGTVLASRLAGEPLPARCSGIDVAEALLCRAAYRDWRIFFYGGAYGVAEQAAQKWKKTYPFLQIRTAYGFGGSPLQAIRDFAPHLLFVCLGAPKQEAWIMHNRPHLSCTCLGLGGALDVWAGRVPRAPHLMQRYGLEWAYRVYKEPKRLTRLAPLPRYFAAATGQGLQNLQKTLSFSHSQEDL